MKALLVAAMAISTLTAAVSVAPATANAAVKVVIKPGGARYYYGGRHWRHRTWVCKRRFHHKVCKYRYW